MQVDRSVLGRSWRLRACDESTAIAISQRHGIADLLGPCPRRPRRLLCSKRGAFLSPRLRDWLPDPFHLIDLDRAADRLADAVLAREPVGLIGDYDVDGATATALLTRYLRWLGVPVAFEIPDRLRDGYGPNARVLDALADQGCRLLVTLDTGTTAFEPLRLAAARGLEVVVIDHHAAEETLPEAVAVVNPNRIDQASPLKHLAAVGVTFVVLVAVTRVLRERGAFSGGRSPHFCSGSTSSPSGLSATWSL